MAQISEVRITMAALLYAIETDLRNVIVLQIIAKTNNLDFFGDNNLKSRTVDRFQKDNPDSDPQINNEALVDYLDFQDSYTIILKNKTTVDTTIYDEVKRLTPSLDQLVPVRNRVMHSRPIMVEDLPTILSFSESVSISNSTIWSTLRGTLKKIHEDPSYVFSLSIPELGIRNDRTIHNLPFPEFDDTGFVGRKKETDEIKKLIIGNTRVLSLIGDGGIGKTALAIKVAYDILDLGEKSPFEFIIWTTAKTKTLTTKGIQEIKVDIDNAKKLIARIGSVAKIEHQNTVDEDTNEVLAFLESNPTLLIIDNLETILDEDVRIFIREAQERCKIIITSRIGLGELEFRKNIGGLSELDCMTLITQYARIKQSEILKQLPREKLIESIKLLHFNPLAIKWFVNTIETGIKPDTVLSQTKPLLQFCLSNVYQKLSEQSSTIIKTILSARKGLNDAELIYVTDLSPLQLRSSLNELFTTTFVSRTIEVIEDSREIKYTIPDFAKEYLLTNHQIPLEFVKSVTTKLNKLSTDTESLKYESTRSEFDANNIAIRTPSEIVVAKLLYNALHHSKSDDYEKAFQILEHAKEILPNYSETYRVSAFIKANSGDILGAEREYELGIHCDSDSFRLQYFFAGFLLYQMRDAERAIVLARSVCNEKPDEEVPALLVARCLSTMGDMEQALSTIEDIRKRMQLSQIGKRNVSTTEISILCKQGIEAAKNKGNLETAQEALSRVLRIYEEHSAGGNLDDQLVSKFWNNLKYFILALPRTVYEKSLARIEVLVKNPNVRSIAGDSESFFEKIRATHDSNSGLRLDGKIVRIQSHRRFFFISYSAGDIFASFHQVPLVQQKKIKTDAVVTFSIGQNNVGKCATKINIA